MKSSSITLLLFSGLGLARAFDGCPCVQDYVKFYFDLRKGCSRHGIDNPLDFTKADCKVKDQRTKVAKVLYHDHQGLEEGKGKNVTLPVIQEEGGATYFEYHRNYAAPSMLLIDFYSSTNKLLATIDLFYDVNNHDCVLAKNAIFWPKDKLYFLTVDAITETADPHCYFPHENDEAVEEE